MKSKEEILQRIKKHESSIELGGFDTDEYYKEQWLNDPRIFSLLKLELMWVLGDDDNDY